MLPQKLCPNISSHGCISLQETCIATCLIMVKSDSILPCKCASVLCDDVPETLGGSSHFSTAPEHSLVACFPLAPFAEPLNSRVVLAVAAYYTDLRDRSSWPGGRRRLACRPGCRRRSRRDDARAATPQPAIQTDTTVCSSSSSSSSRSSAGFARFSI